MLTLTIVALSSLKVYMLFPTREHSRINPASRVFNFLADATQLGCIARHQSSASLHIVKGRFPRNECPRGLWYRCQARDKSVLDHQFLMRFTGPVQWERFFVGNTNPIIGLYNLPGLKYGLWADNHSHICALAITASLHYVHVWLLNHQGVADSP